MKTKLSETDIKYQIKEYLQWTGWYCFSILQGLGAKRGIADIFAIKNGRNIWIEVKTGKGKQSEYQRRFEEEITSHNGTYWLIHSLDELMEKLRLSGYQRR